MEKWSLVLAEWEDVHVTHSACQSDDFLVSYKPCIRRTLGHVIDENDKYVAIAETDDREAQLTESDCERVNVIPRAYLLKIVPLSRPKKAKR